MNPLEGIRNNVMGTKAVADAALKTGVERFILISSDKAVRPTNVMGATKDGQNLLSAIMEILRSRKVRHSHFRAFGSVMFWGLTVRLCRCFVSRLLQEAQ